MSYSIAHSFPYSPLKVCAGVAAVLAVAYIGLIAVIMSYAAHTVAFSQSVRNEESAVAALESEYLAATARITKIDYAALGYAAPAAKVFVSTKNVTALR